MITTDAAALAFALLTLAAQLATVAIVTLAVIARWSPAAASRLARLRVDARGNGLWVAFLVAAVSTFGSLYFSEVANFPPCRLCWYQRIGMYPLTVILGLAAWRRDTTIRPYAGALAALALPISAYHVLLERFPSLETGSCEVDNPCSLIWVEKFGYITIPVMALTGFALILTLLFLVVRET